MDIKVDSSYEGFVKLSATSVRTRYVRRRPVTTFAGRLRRAKARMIREGRRRERKIERTDAATERFRETLG